jgi:RNA polymerase sigma factor for flagellar operon FliA
MVSEAEEDVATLWQTLRDTRDPTVRERLIIRYGAFARAIASRLYSSRPDDSTPFDDYLQYARVGLIESLDRYDNGLGASFETFSSYRIRGAILSGLSRDTELRAQRSQWRVRMAERSESLVSGSIDRPDTVSLEEFVQLTVGLAIGVMLEGGAEESVDESVEANPYSAAELAQLRSKARAVVEQLPPREREVIRRHYYEGMEFQEVAGFLNVTKGRVSQLHSRALERIRELLDARPKIDRKL